MMGVVTTPPAHAQKGDECNTCACAWERCTHTYTASCCQYPCHIIMRAMHSLHFEGKTHKERKTHTMEWNTYIHNNARACVRRRNCVNIIHIIIIINIVVTKPSPQPSTLHTQHLKATPLPHALQKQVERYTQKEQHLQQQQYVAAAAAAARHKTKTPAIQRNIYNGPDNPRLVIGAENGIDTVGMGVPTSASCMRSLTSSTESTSGVAPGGSGMVESLSCCTTIWCSVSCGGGACMGCADAALCATAAAAACTWREGEGCDPGGYVGIVRPNTCAHIHMHLIQQNPQYPNNSSTHLLNRSLLHGNLVLGRHTIAMLQLPTAAV